MSVRTLVAITVGLAFLLPSAGTINGLFVQHADAAPQASPLAGLTPNQHFSVIRDLAKQINALDVDSTGRVPFDVRAHVPQHIQRALAHDLVATPSIHALTSYG